MGHLGHEGHSFEAVESVLANPFPPGTDPEVVRLPSVPRLRSPEDTEANHLLYWQAHLWETLLRYRRAYHDPACTERLRAGYTEVAEAAVHLAERATSGFPLSPIDSVGCHTALKELHAGALGLEATVAALASGADAVHAPAAAPAPVAHPDFTATPATTTSAATPPAARTGGAAGEAVIADADADVDAGEVVAATAPLSPDLFAHTPPARSFEFKLNLRGGRGLRRGRSMAGGTPTEDAGRD